MVKTVQASIIIALHKERIIQWKSSAVTLQHENFYRLVEENHAFNYQLWHTEDKARRDDMGYEFVYQAKRDIDRFNQLRNNRMEAMDEWLFQSLQPAEFSSCPVHSESPGMIIDRLSILALKSYHMALQADRPDVDEHHRTSCRNKSAVIHQQLTQLSSCLEQLLIEIIEKKRTFRVYHQFKMYNDPNLNPELYAH